MKRDRSAGREYAEIWGEAVQANRKLRRIVVLLAASCVLGVVVLLRIAGAEPPRPIVIRVDEVGRAEALAYEAATAQADPLDPTTKVLPQPVRGRLPLAPPRHGRGALDPEPPVPSRPTSPTPRSRGTAATSPPRRPGRRETEKPRSRTSCSASTPPPNHPTARPPTSISCT